MIFQGVARLNALKLTAFIPLLKEKIWDGQSKIKKLVWFVALLAAIIQPFQWAVGAAKLFTEKGFKLSILSQAFPPSKNPKA